MVGEVGPEAEAETDSESETDAESEPESEAEAAAASGAGNSDRSPITSEFKSAPLQRGCQIRLSSPGSPHGRDVDAMKAVPGSGNVAKVLQKVERAMKFQ